jgi:hypothetical protein
MIFKKGNMWKVAGSSAKYATEEEALKAAGIHQAVMREAPVEKAPVEKTTWSPLEKLRGKSSDECEECECDPCECEEEWKSADET